MITKTFNGLKYKIETIEDYLTDMEIKYMTGNVKGRRNMDAIMYSEFSSDDLSYSKINKEIEKIIRKNGGYTVIPKEVKKVSRPYFELKVIKIKKPKYQSREVIKFMGKKYEVFIKDGKVSIRRHKHQYKPIGNWVNRENVDKIKFPCFCSYKRFGKRKYGILIQGFVHNLNEYILNHLDMQYEDIPVEIRSHSLKKLIADYDIHILKGKVIVYEEVTNE